MDKAMKLIKYKENPNYSKEKEELKKCNWMALVSSIGVGGNIGQISLKCRKSLIFRPNILL